MKNNKRTLDHARLASLLSYCHLTGDFTWNKKKGRCQKGEKAGAVNGVGYRLIQIDGVRYYAHRLAWLYVNGYMAEVIDHINGVRDDNRIVNLRPASYLTNSYNTSKNKGNTSGYRGVVWHKQRKKWVVQIKVGGKTRSFGLYDDINVAAEVAKQERKKLHGEFYAER